ncbi:5'-nucleotidase, lipoprotein e(P4) family [Woeseia oceani]|uniref:Acid phosphatase n=1 Tax=Woeseia oceani TaxID=1548547 RepID=A0A193LFE4_9GAMM|nr:HAD family acid phosphatase [Woeseia oceani]ANO51176.1 acid phosphatase [Woeseia oceani]
MIDLTDHDRRRILALILAAGGAASTAPALAASVDNDDSNPLLWALAWQQTAAEFQALCYQAYSLARLRLQIALAQRDDDDRPLAVIADLDNTVLHANSYWGYLVNEGKDFFDDAIWDEWLPENLMTAVPGALDFLAYCKQQGVEVFYVTNRDQGERTYEYALVQLQELEFPYADSDHLYVFRETSDKTPARRSIEQRFDIALMLGDNLNDFRRDYYVKDVAERMALMERDRADWGDKFILLPNPTDGHWVRAIFGESEPQPTDANRARLRLAATRLAWNGRRE